MRLSIQREGGQALVESALTFPMMLFTLLGILQLTLAYHARILAEYAVFKAARSGSVYRADCEKMKMAALAALAPSTSYTLANNPDMKTLYKSTQDLVKTNQTGHGTPIAWLDYELENLERDFDYQHESDSDEVMRIRVKLAYFFHYRIPFANWVMVRFWLATQRGFHWATYDPTMLNMKAESPPARQTVDADLLDQVEANMGHSPKVYSSPIVASWSMRMMSEPTDAAKSKTGKWKCK
ncbi:MAG: pilus assembly protein [Deltaproteobacteria bacterium]|nr:pilus assembly protein [Deltaproteobacteria bacterium]